MWTRSCDTSLDLKQQVLIDNTHVFVFVKWDNPNDNTENVFHRLVIGKNELH